MNGQVVLELRMTLLSDAIFGSGYSIPGGEDIAVCRDAEGYPYVKGTTVKGLLRESMKNLIAWTGADSGTVRTLFGERGWSGTDDSRCLRFTKLRLIDPPSAPEDCFGERAFTSMENGAAKEGSLRIAACVRKGMQFSGEIVCNEQDAGLVQDALRGIKWAGTMRSRGFGRVSICSEVKAVSAAAFVSSSCQCIHYRLHTESAVQITDLNRSRDNNYETQGFIPGSAVRGMAIHALASGKPEWFATNKSALLSENVRFLDAVPNPRHLAALPSIKGFYENKEETQLENVVLNGTFTPGLKRAKIGSFCALEGSEIRYWSAKTEGSTRIHRKTAQEDAHMFQTRCISPGQDFDGYIVLDDPALSVEIMETFAQTVWLGADRYAGLGKCKVTAVEAVDCPSWIDAYGYQSQMAASEKLYLLAVSPFTMLSGNGTPCGINKTVLAEKLGVGAIKIRYCSTSLTEAGSYNRTWQCRAPSVRMYDRGSIFQIICDRVPSLLAIQRLQAEGLGIRRAEGFGQILFLRPELFEGLSQKSILEQSNPTSGYAAQVRRAKYAWVMEHTAEVVRSCVSSSQIGTIQALCEKSVAKGNTSELDAFLRKNLEGRGAAHGERFKGIVRLIEQVLKNPLADTFEIPHCEDSICLRLELLCMLFDHSRKGIRLNGEEC